MLPGIAPDQLVTFWKMESHCPAPIVTFPFVSGRASRRGCLARVVGHTVGRRASAGEAVVCHVFWQKNWPVFLTELYAKTIANDRFFNTIWPVLWPLPSLFGIKSAIQSKLSKLPELPDSDNLRRSSGGRANYGCNDSHSAMSAA